MQGENMGKVVIHVTMSLDGFIAGPNEEMDWAFKYDAGEMIDEVMKEIGAVVIGNRGFREGSMNESTLPYGGTVNVPQFVVTHEPRDPVSAYGLTFTFPGDLMSTIEAAKAAAGEKSVTLLGASNDQQALNLGLGDGVRLFENLDAGPVELERTEIVSTSQITSLRFRVVK
jgi:dihydrofolate reductase